MTKTKTPKRKSSRRKSSQAVDLITGKEKVEYFFDPSLVLIPTTKTPRTPKRGSDSGSSSQTIAHKHLFSPCTIVKRGEECTLTKTSDGTLYKLTSDKLIQLTQQDRLGLEDVLHLPNITEPSLLHTLRVRYNRDEIYTNAGPILISINPYKTILKLNSSIYSESNMISYRKNKSSAPHLFGIANRAYNALTTKDRNQAIIISGESGAGKTEATKIIMQYLAKTSHGAGHAGSETNRLEEQVLASNPLLESFGNARTLRNDNSSRFGKFIQIKFQDGHISGASIQNYLLEKTRIVHQIEGERNYHIFYQLLSDEALCAELGLDNAEGFQYLSKRFVKSKRDEKGLCETKECLDNIGLYEEEQRIIFQIVAGVLHLGNIQFTPGGEGEDGDEVADIVEEASKKSLATACKLLGLEESAVSKAILTKILSVGGKTITKSQNVVQANDKRDALAKMVYSSLFLWLVSRINTTIHHAHSPEELLSPSSAKSFDFEEPEIMKSIGVLDIYGFEQFDVNGFEQLLINYANEKLQRHFNKHLFEVEQELYAQEGVDWTYITFNDNRPCLELIEGGGGSIGILGTLDDAWGGMGSGNEKDVKFVSHLHQLFGGSQETSGSVMKKKKGSDGKHPNFQMPKFSNDKDFIVVHYAGEVRYTANGFVEKNVESLSNELKSLGMTSSSELSKEIFTHSSDESNIDDSNHRSRSTIRGVSVASQFKTSLQTLVSDLEQTEPHYIRCLKPNLKKASNSFEAGEALRQLQYAGMMEAIRIRREGYALREPHESFYNKFHILLDSEDLKGGEGIEHLVQVLSKRLSVTDVDWQVGHSKIFLRRELATKLETLTSLRVHSAARTIGRFGRSVAHKRAGNLLTAWARLRLHFIKKNRELKGAIKIQTLYRMMKVQRAFRKEKSAAIKIQAIARLLFAKEVARKLRDPFQDMTFEELEKLYQEQTERLEEAVSSKDYERAAELEKNIVPLKEALENKRPMTRAFIDSMIVDVEEQLEKSVAEKDYASCPPLQQRLDELNKMKEDHPTIEELRHKLQEAQQAVDAAAQSRDFSGAAARQAAVDYAKQHLEKALAAEGITNEDSPSVDEEVKEEVQEEEPKREFSSRSELDEKLTLVKSEVENAIEKKDFKAASENQESLDRLELLRVDYPTVKELESAIAQKEDEMAIAIKNKHFAGAGNLQEEIDALQDKIKHERSHEHEEPTQDKTALTDQRLEICLPDGTLLQLTSRAELESKISAYESEVQKAASEKNFAKATQIQELITELERVRPQLPTLQEMIQHKREVEKEMEECMQSKNFAKAGDLHDKISELENMIKNEEVKRQLFRPKDEQQSPSEKKEDNEVTQPILLQVKVEKPNKTYSMSKTRNNTKAHMPTEPIKQTKVIPTKTQFTEKREKPVSKLRPKKPLISNINDNVLMVAQMLASKRGSASLVIGVNGGLAGIVTDTDVTRRLVARDLNAANTNVSKVMTANPTVVSMSDPAMDALSTMVENHFRHLPVVDDNGAVVGVLDIAKCLNDAIGKLEKAEEKNGNVAEDAVMQMAALQGAGGQQAAMLTQLLGPLMAQAFGNKGSPTLRTLLAGKPATIVSPGCSLKKTAVVMAEAKKAALVVDNGELVGIFGFKDMMSRVVAKELPLEHTSVKSVMTPNPESVSPDMTVIEALQTMHDNKFLNLPVCEDDGTVCGLVGVMDLIIGCGGADGWRSLFDSTIGMSGDDSGSHHSGSVSTTRMSSAKKAQSVQGLKNNINMKPVSKLRPRRAVTLPGWSSGVEVCQLMASKRSTALLVTNESNDLSGIITDHDIVRRVVARHKDPSDTAVSTVMTADPSIVAINDPADESLSTMIENHFRYLPVVDESGKISGILDIGKCLNDAISKLEKKMENGSSATDDKLNKILSSAGGKSVNASALSQLLGPLMAQAFNKGSPTLRTLLAGKPATGYSVNPKSSILVAGMMMAEKRKAALVVQDERLIGIVAFKDIVTRAIAKELSLENTEVMAIMTPEPEYVSPDTTVIEAMQIMHDSKFLTLPVCESNGTVCGVVDIMDLIYGAGGVEGWRSIFDSALEMDDISDSRSINSSESASVVRGDRAMPLYNGRKQDPVIHVTNSPYASAVLNNVPNHVEFNEGDQVSMGDSLLDRTLSYPVVNSPDRPALSEGDVAFKIIDADGHKYVVRCDAIYNNLLKAIAGKIDEDVDEKSIRLKYIDEEGDAINVSSDDCLTEAIANARKSGNLGVKLILTIMKEESKSIKIDQKTLAMVGGVALAIGIGAIAFLKPRA